MRNIVLALTAAAVAAVLMPAAASAQDVGPALDPGGMTGWAGGEAVRHSLNRRSGPSRPVRLDPNRQPYKSDCRSAWSRLQRNVPWSRDLDTRRRCVRWGMWSPVGSRRFVAGSYRGRR